MASVSLEGVSKVYAKGGSGSRSPAPAVHDFSLHVEDHELLVLVGPSGCGKSTVLRLIAGLEDATSGVIRIDGREVDDVPPRERDVAMVFQSYALYPHLSVRKNLSFALESRRVPRAEIDGRVLEVAATLGLSSLLDRRPRALSGGEKQRVALGRAIVRQPRVFLFDEPLSNLDATLRAEMRSELRRLHDRLRTTMIYVTHDQIEAMTLGERIVVMRKGEIQQAGPPLEIYRHPRNRYVAGFIGAPPMNFLRGEVSSAGGRPAVRLGRGVLLLPDGLATGLGPPSLVEIGLRPEDVRLSRGGPGGIDARVEMVEALGDQTLVHFATEAGRVVARLYGRESLRVGEVLVVGAVPEDLHVFSAADGSSLRIGPAVK